MTQERERSEARGKQDRGWRLPPRGSFRVVSEREPYYLQQYNTNLILIYDDSTQYKKGISFYRPGCGTCALHSSSKKCNAFTPTTPDSRVTSRSITCTLLLYRACTRIPDRRCMGHVAYSQIPGKFGLGWRKSSSGISAGGVPRSRLSRQPAQPAPENLQALSRSHSIMRKKYSKCVTFVQRNAAPGRACCVHSFWNFLVPYGILL